MNITARLEKIFNWWGRLVARHPCWVIVTTLVLTGISAFGFVRIRQEKRGDHLWLSPTSDFNIHSSWLQKHFKQSIRNEQLLIKTDNLLTPEGLKQMLEVHKSIEDISVKGKSFADFCLQIPSGDIFRGGKKRRKRNTDNTTNVTTPDGSEDYDEYSYEYIFKDYNNQDYDSANVSDAKKDQIWRRYTNYERKASKLPPQIYCDLFNTLDRVCMQRSILEIWQYDPDQIAAASQQDILDAVNLLSVSPQFTTPFHFSSLLGGITRNNTGHVVGATTAIMYWGLAIPEGAPLVLDRGGGFEARQADALSLAWEQEFITRTLNMSSDNVTVLPFSNRSFGDVSDSAVFFDGVKLAIGYLLMFIFTVCMLGKFDLLEIRLYLSIGGIVGIVMGYVIAIGVTCALGFPITPMSILLPFILLGIGIDDMFVIMQTLTNLDKDPSTLTNLDKDPSTANIALEERVGLALQHAGVSITVTTATDVLAFAVGCFSDTPGIVSFCVAGSVGLLSVYLLSISWFTAWLSLDEARISARRSGVAPCQVLENYKSPSYANRRVLEKMFEKVSNLQQFVIYKVCVVLVAAILLGFGVWGSLWIKKEFDWLLIMPEESYLRKHLRMFEEDYFQNGQQFIPNFPFYWGTGDFFTGSLNHTHLASLENLVEKLKQLEEEDKYIGGFDFWWEDIKKYAKKEKNIEDWRSFANEKDFSLILSDFLFSSYGTRFQLSFKFDDQLRCNHPAPNITATKSSISFQKKVVDDAREHVPAKTTVANIIQESNFSTEAFVHLDLMYFAWESEEVTNKELWPTMGITMACIIVITLILLASFPMCFMVNLCVSLTIVDTVGCLYFWNVKMFFVSMIYIVMAIGLSVDFSVHIAYAYLVAKGSRQERSSLALITIGPAVLNGGITTFLAIILLAFSTTSITEIFFKVIILTIIFGLFHGLIFFPVLLSFAGPIGKIESCAESKGEEVSKKNIEVSNTSCDVNNKETIELGIDNDLVKNGNKNNGFVI